MGYWPLDDGPGAGVAVDHSGNNQNGVYVSALDIEKQAANTTIKYGTRPARCLSGVVWQGGLVVLPLTERSPSPPPLHRRVPLPPAF